jgi:hypothetical protein
VLPKKAILGNSIFRCLKPLIIVYLKEDVAQIELGWVADS